MRLEEIKLWYKDLCSLGEAIDPISNWFVLLQLIQRSKKAKLKKEALLAQEYYKLAKMVGAFIYDLTREIMPDPDDLMDEGKGTWKSKIYGQPFNYNSKQTRVKIIDNYFIDRLLSIALIYEGLTEDTVLNMIFEVLSVDQDTEGIFSWNATGQGNIKENLNALAKLARANEMEVFLILDRDGDWLDILNDFKKRGYIREGTYHVWEKDFESDNFSIDEVVKKVNYLLGQKLLNKVEKSDVIDRMNNNPALVMMKAISDSFWEKNRVQTERSSIEKRVG